MLRLRLLQLLVLVADRLPVALLYALASVAARFAWLVAPGLREVTRDHMRHVLPAAAPRSAIDRAARGAIRSAALRRSRPGSCNPPITPPRVINTSGTVSREIVSKP